MPPTAVPLPPPTRLRSTLCSRSADYCWSCAEGTRQDPLTGACTPCSPGCASCDVDGATGRETCTSCDKGFELKEVDPQPGPDSYITKCVKKAGGAA